MKKTILFLVFAVSIWACGGGGDTGGNNEAEGTKTTKPKSVDNGKGIGEIKEVKLNNPLDASMVQKGEAIFNMKCAACHKLSGKRVVGPGWAGLTDRRKPEWIMNMITNVDIMLAEDPAAQKMLEECLTRMPNQNVSIGDARDLLEFAYQNDMDQAAKKK